MRKFLIHLIEFYQAFLSFDRGVLMFLAPGGACKGSVSCSQYTKQAIHKYGATKGIWLGLKRIWRCR